MTIQITVSRDSFSFPSVTDRITILRKSIKELIASLHQFTSSASSSAGSISDSARSHQLRRQFKKNKFFFIPVAIVVVLLLVGIVYAVRNANSSSGNVAGTSDAQVELEKPLATQTINKTFSFPLKDGDGKEVSTIKYTIESAELRDEIIVNGRRARLVKGRTFLIIPVKITNSYNQSVQISARDYIRLVVDNNTNEKFAPDISIEKDPVEVQAISTKRTRIGFPIDDTATNLVLQVGEINGSKENIKLTLKK